MKPCRLRKRTSYGVRQEVTQKLARRAILLVAGAVLFVFAIPYFHMVDTGGSGTVCRRILPAYDPHEPLALEAAVLAGDGEWKRCNERYHGRDDPHYDSAIVRFNDLLNPPHPVIARIQANLNHSKDTRSGNINKTSPPE